MIAALILSGMLFAQATAATPPQPIQRLEEPSADSSADGSLANIETEGEMPVNGIHLHVRVEGPTDGRPTPPPLFVIHGGPGLDHTYFMPWLDPLAHELKVVYFDQRGCGRSERLADTTAYAMSHTLEDIEALRDSLGADQISLLGFSYGGFVALQYALAHPSRVHKLILSDTAPSMAFVAEAESLQKARTKPAQTLAMKALERRTDLGPDERFREEFRLELPLNFHNGRKQSFIDGIADRIRYGAEMSGYIGRHDLNTYDVRPRLGELKMPVLVMVGDDDIVTPPSQARIMAEGIRAGGNPNVTHRIIAGAGHLSMVDDPNNFNRNILEFLREPAGQR